MNRKHFLLAMAVVLAAGGWWWFARSSGRTHAVGQSGMKFGSDLPTDPPGPDRIRALPGSNAGAGSGVPPGGTNSVRRPDPRPPEPNRLFLDFTPEQRVEFARKGHGPGG